MTCRARNLPVGRVYSGAPWIEGRVHAPLVTRFQSWRDCEKLVKETSERNSFRQRISGDRFASVAAGEAPVLPAKPRAQNRRGGALYIRYLQRGLSEHYLQYTFHNPFREIAWYISRNPRSSLKACLRYDREFRNIFLTNILTVPSKII